MQAGGEREERETALRRTLVVITVGLEFSQKSLQK